MPLLSLRLDKGRSDGNPCVEVSDLQENILSFTPQGRTTNRTTNGGYNMNNSKAKALRKLAQEATIGKPGHKFEQQTVTAYKDPLKKRPTYYIPCPRKLAPCTRLIYKTLKRINA